MKCDYCGRDESLPFVCNYCGGAFCPDHRLPEAHQCKGDLTQRRTISAPQTTTFSWQTSSQPQYPTARTSNAFSKIEIRDIVIAWVGIGIAVAIAFPGGIFAGFSLGRLLILTGVALVTIGPGFVLHELSHKFVARHYGFWAEFRMWPQMLAMCIIISLMGFLFAAPGATYIMGNDVTKEENGIISIAGPLTNVAISLLFIPVYLLGGPGSLLQFTGALGLYINLWLAVFNLIPLGPLDGSKVFRWNKGILVVSFAVLALATVFVFLYVWGPVAGL